MIFQHFFSLSWRVAEFGKLAQRVKAGPKRERKKKYFLILGTGAYIFFGEEEFDNGSRSGQKLVKN